MDRESLNALEGTDITKIKPVLQNFNEKVRQTTLNQNPLRNAPYFPLSVRAGLRFDSTADEWTVACHMEVSLQHSKKREERRNLPRMPVMRAHLIPRQDTAGIQNSANGFRLLAENR